MKERSEKDKLLIFKKRLPYPPVSELDNKKKKRGNCQYIDSETLDCPMTKYTTTHALYLGIRNNSSI